jgi:UDP-N-acetylmuramate--alanine ligase
MRLAQSKVHFIGIGGIGMCGLAELLHNMGVQVTGSDQSENAQVARLRELGILVQIGHRADHIGTADVVVFSSAVKSSNVEYVEAGKRQIPRIPRAEVLAEIMRLKRGVAVAGTHGKTTTTSMAAAIFLHAQMKPTIVVGGRLDLIKSTALLGEGEWLIAEADESDGSFSKLSPEIAIITNIDNDHMDHYQTFANLQHAFMDFAARIPFYGLLVICGDDEATFNYFSTFSKRILFYGFHARNDFVIRSLNTLGHYEVLREGRNLGEIELQVPGRHNAINALAALIVGLEAGLPFATCRAGLQQYHGVDRRFQHKGSRAGIDVYDDYGHHPTEVRAVLQAFREKFPQRRVVVAFQPHRYTRTQICWQDFTQSFSDADLVYVYDIYAAGEPEIAGIHSRQLATEISGGKAHYLGPREGAVACLLASLNQGDVLVTLGAGDVWKDGMEILERL